MESMPQSSNTSSEKLTAFSYFPHLPTELRLKIWQLCLPAPRDLYLKPKKVVTSMGFHHSGAVLHINREAREVGLARYELAFGSCHRAGMAYIDFERDSLKLTRAGPNSIGMFLSGGFWGADGAEKIRNLEFEIELNMWDRDDFCWSYAKQFTGLMNLDLIIYEHFIDEVEIPAIRQRLRIFAGLHPEWKAPKIRIWFDKPSMKRWVTFECPNITGTMS